MAKLFLGLDSSTQSLSAVIIDYDTRKVVYDKSLNFNKVQPSYGTQNGVLPNPDPLVKHSSPLLWAQALDALFAMMKSDGAPLGEILAISGSGQQHGSVYFNNRAAAAFAHLDSGKSLVENLDGTFSRSTAVIWMDSSTAAECAEIRAALGGVKATAELTGSDTFERFTGPQIRKFYKTNPEAYAQTVSIALVSSFMASLLAGKLAPIDYGDGAGMNLMDIHKKVWHGGALKATAPDLEKKLPPLADSAKVIGPISPYFTKKFGFNSQAQIFPWSGDNPCSVVGLGLIKEGMVGISLGTSDTYFGSMAKCHTDANGEGHAFGSPAGGYMSMICFQNGSLAREKIRDAYGIKSWKEFGELMAAKTPGNNGGILLPWYETEIVPRVNRPGIHRFDLDEKDAAANCRAIVEGQMLSKRLHAQWMKVMPDCIYATGGASNDPALLRVLADVMNCRVSRIEISKSAALGAAFMAAHGWLVQTGENPTWETVVAGFTKPVPGSDVLPNPEAARVYDRLIEKYAACEQEALKKIRA